MSPIIRWSRLKEHVFHDVAVSQVSADQTILECITCGCTIIEENIYPGSRDEFPKQKP